MKFYHKIFKNNPDLSTYLENVEPLAAYAEELLNLLTQAKDIDELHKAKCSILRDFREIYIFDMKDAEFPEPEGHFDSEEEKNTFIKNKILLHDVTRYLGSVYKKYHILIYEKSGMLPVIELKNLAIDYNEIYIKAMHDYINAIENGMTHAVTASFGLPSLIERGLAINLQNRMLYKCICELPDEKNLKVSLTSEEKRYVRAFCENTDKILFNARENYVMGKMYNIFVREGALEPSLENEMILTGVGHKNKKKLTRTLGSMLKSDFAQKEIIPEYLEIMEDIFGKLNIRNCIMHGLEETFDYLNIGLVSIMFQLLWDIAECEIFKD